MNIIDVQDRLKDFSEQQLITEMQRPSGTAPQFLVLSEIQRRKRMRDDFARREAAQQQTVAQEAVAAAGVPQAGIAGMSEAMAPKSTMAQGGIGSIMNQAMRQQPQPAMPMAEGGVIRANIGAFFNADGSVTKAGLRALIGQESGGDPTARGSVDEVGLTQIRPGTAIMPGYGVQSMFPNIASLIGPGKKYDTNKMEMADAVQKAYEDNRELIDAGLIDPDRSTAFSQDYLTAMSKRFPDDPNRALAAYNVGPEAAAKLENPAEFGYVTSVLGRMGDAPANEPGMLATALDTTGDVLGSIFGSGTAYAQGVQAPAVPAAPVVQEPPRTLSADRKSMILGTIAMGKSNPALLASQARGFLEDPLVAADPDIIAALREAGIEPASTARVVTEPITVDQDVILPSGEVVEAGETLEVGDVLDFQTAEFIGAEGSTTGTGGTVGSIDSQSAAEDEMINDYLLGRLTDDGQPTGFKPMITEEGLESLAIPPGALSAEGDEAVTTEESDGSPEESDTEKDDGTNQEPEKGDGSNVEFFGGEKAVSSIEAEIAKLKSRLEKNRESDKWLALAQAGLALMSSKEPTLLGAAGEAGISGLSAFREAQERYQEGIIDLVNAEAKLRDKKGGMTAASGVSRLNAIEKMLNPTDVTEIAPLDDETRTRLEEEAKYIRRNILGYKDIVA
jgi:soluble lytic murein transglycosylase-like protein